MSGVHGTARNGGKYIRLSGVGPQYPRGEQSVSAANEATDERHEGWHGHEAQKHDHEPLVCKLPSTKICEQGISSACQFAIVDVEYRGG